MPTPAPSKPPHVREITPRSVTVGLLVALVIGASYPYVVLKFGFGSQHLPPPWLLSLGFIAEDARRVDILLLIMWPAVGMLVVCGIFLGALADTIWARTSPEQHVRYSVPVAAGLIAGAALVAVVIPILVTVGLMQLPV